MCTPPFCEPARRCLGCISLKNGAAMIILLNGCYGILLVMVHMFISQEPPKDYGLMAAPTDGSMMTTASPLEKVLTDHSTFSVYKQILDLDYGLAHGILGLNDGYLCTLGFIYGITIFGFSSFVLYTVLAVTRTAAVISRWFMMFLHLELIIYVITVLIKLPLLCQMKQHYLTLMDMDCSVLWYMFFERAAFRIILMSLCCWVFSSFAYLLAWGDAGIHDASLGDDIDQDLRRRGGYGFPQAPLTAVSVSPQGFPPQGFSPPTQGYPSHTRASFDQVSLAGEPVSVGGSRYEPRWVNPSHQGGGGYQGSIPGGASFQSQGRGGGSFQQLQGFQQSQGRYAGSQHIMPRASSSHQSNATDVSHAERQMLIKPPIVIH